MEYYWSDFMNICDDLGPHSKVNLGEEHVFGIPETLHFVATINNDHTTETLSPRLIDRAWVITLPQLTLRDYSSSVSEAKIPAEIIEVIPLDYAVAQRILPKIIGNGEEFEKWLNEFGSLCSSNGLNTSARMVKNIIERGNHQMKYYQFFC